MRFILTITALFIIMLPGIVSLKGSPASEVAKADLGRRLFREKLLSKDSSISCASCHKPEYAFADTVAYSKGIYGSLTHRNTPSVLNMKDRPYFFWDGRAATLEAQSLIPIANPEEMGLSIAEAVERLNASPVYMTLFNRVFGQRPNSHNLSAAFSAYEKTLETVNSRFDDWTNKSGTPTANEEKGRQLFLGKARCFSCHFAKDFTGDGFKNIGLFNGHYMTDSGRYLITGKATDLGKFKTPGLRNIAVTAPYMHNGMFSTLAEVVRYYNDPRAFIPNPVNIDPLLTKPLHLSPREQNNLVAFLETLTDKQYLKNALSKRK